MEHIIVVSGGSPAFKVAMIRSRNIGLAHTHLGHALNLERVATGCWRELGARGHDRRAAGR
jgi:hypothetical protein